MRATLWSHFCVPLVGVILLAVAIAATGPASATGTPFRIGGVDRYDTAAQVSDAQLGGCQVAIANGEDYPDGLAGAVFGFPVLLTRPDALPPVTAAELARIDGACVPGGISLIYVLGGTSAVSQAVFNQLTAYTSNVQRLGGADRYETAIEIAREFGVRSEVILATGADFPDALAAGPLAGLSQQPILLNDGEDLLPEVVAFLTAHNVRNVIILGGTAAVPASIEVQLGKELGISSERLTGDNRVETATRIADFTFNAPGCVLVINGNAFADALAAGPLGEDKRCPITLASRDLLPTATRDWLVQNKASLQQLQVIGGSSVISQDVLDAAVAAALLP